jgi:hypothetical protein
MNKKIIFSLLLITITTFSHGMEKIMCDKHCDEKALKEEIDTYAHDHQTSHCRAAINLMQTNDCYRPIFEKIDDLFIIAHDPNQQFPEENLRDPWYVNATEGCSQFKNNDIKRSTLLTTTYKAEHIYIIPLHKIKALLHAKTNIKNAINNNLLTEICRDRQKMAAFKEDLLTLKDMPGLNDDSFSLLKTFSQPIIQMKKSKHTQLLTIAKLLLQHGADPNFTLSDEHHTPLMTAVTSNDTEYAHLLLWYNANPYKNVITKFDVECGIHERIYNAFDLEKTGWLKKMIRDKQQTIFKYWLFTHHNLAELTLLPDIINFIRYKIWEVGKNSFKTVQLQIDQSEQM